MMEYHQSSQIPTLSYIENEDHPVFGTLVEQILHLLNSKLVFSDVIIHQNSPLMLRQPKGLDAINRQRSGHIITIEDPVETLIPQRKCIITQREVGEDADVGSYYLGALDALRERPDVIVIGEIRDAQTAQEALALAESGPLVLATLHARSTELGLQKMLRLLGNSEAQGQALAHALRGVLCQALLPSS